jgi:hypothetical protein
VKSKRALVLGLVTAFIPVLIEYHRLNNKTEAARFAALYQV